MPITTQDIIDLLKNLGYKVNANDVHFDATVAYEIELWQTLVYVALKNGRAILVVNNETKKGEIHILGTTHYFEII